MGTRAKVALGGAVLVAIALRFPTLGDQSFWRDEASTALELNDALGAEFDYLDAIGSVTRTPRSGLLKTIGNRAQAAKDAFTDLPDSQDVEDGIRGTQAFIAWARARR